MLRRQRNSERGRDAYSRLVVKRPVPRQLNSIINGETLYNEPADGTIRNDILSFQIRMILIWKAFCTFEPDTEMLAPRLAGKPRR
ncbi:hypothetical protein [Hymenobacter yonginensis]|uniref:Tn3 transposase DDE domain-containing protein n=1 Tax=Hymenobacter yonginensis TaxID=748197 RepID=A0ABY7PJH2_9BACT|nr:hypothetical protein [Hymenobacter yonginensis]WBO82844.1 hypothetical protein O9Z63_10630 [Hymenobacter yonginensis]